jgi:hypothetical protein
MRRFFSAPFGATVTVTSPRPDSAVASAGEIFLQQPGFRPHLGHAAVEIRQPVLFVHGVLSAVPGKAEPG